MQKKIQSSRFVMDTVKKWRWSSYIVKQGYQIDITTYITHSFEAYRYR